MQKPLMSRIATARVSRRSAVGGVVLGGAAAALFARARGVALAQEATPDAGDECVATAPPAQDGVGLVDLLIEGVVHDMPAGPVRVNLARFTLAPGVFIEPITSPYPGFMYIETGESMCPGGPGRIVYNQDGSVLDVSTGEGLQRIPTGTTQYIPGGVPDGASNQGDTLMSSFVIQFLPAEDVGTPGAATPTG